MVHMSDAGAERNCIARPGSCSEYRTQSTVQYGSLDALLWDRLNFVVDQSTLPLHCRYKYSRS